MLTIGDKFPSFDLKAVVSTDPKKAFTEINERSDEGKWKVVFFWPKDFTFVCPTEIAAFGKLNDDFNDRDAVVYGVSTDSDFVHLAWKQNHADLKDLPFPMLSDIKRALRHARCLIEDAERRSLSIRTASSALSTSPTSMSAVTRKKFFACSTRCRQANSAPATGS